MLNMATSDGDLSATTLAGSDMVYERCCEPCDAEHQHLEAAGFCQPCAVYLCAGCVRDHKKNPASKLHQLLDTATMQHTTIKPKIKDVLTEPCQKHGDKVLEYYCNSDDVLCCHVCLNLAHNSCQSRDYIPDISAGTAASQEYKDVETGMDRLIVFASDEEINISLSDKKNDAYRTNAISSIKTTRKEMDTIIDAAEQQAIKRVDELHRQNAEMINSASEKCQYVLSDTKTMSSDLEEKAKTGKDNQLFVGMKLVGRRLPTMEEEMKQLDVQKIPRYMHDEGKQEVQEFKSVMAAMFSLTVRQNDAIVPVRHVGDVAVKTEDDTKDCFINGIVALSGNRLVVTDKNNSAVKLVDVNLNKVTSRLAVSSGPLDVTRTLSDQVAVSLSTGKKIEIFTATDTLSRIKTIDGTALSGFCYAEDRLIGLSNVPYIVKEVDMTGSVVRTIYKDSDSDPIFKKPRYITFGHARNVIYITDRGTDTVTCMTLKGRIIWVYKHAELKCPMGVAECRGGDVVICSQDTRTVQQLSRSGQLVQVLLDKQRGLASYPAAICVFENKMWVSSGSTAAGCKNYLKMFQQE